MNNYINIVDNDLSRLSSVIDCLQKNMNQIKSENQNQQKKTSEQNEQITLLLKEKQQLNNEKMKLQGDLILISTENDRLVQLVFEKISIIQERGKEIRQNQEKLLTEVDLALNELKEQQEESIQQLLNKLEEQRNHILNLENNQSQLIRKRDKLQSENEQYALKIVSLEKQKHMELGMIKEQASETIKQLEGQISEIKENFENYFNQAEYDKQEIQEKFQDYKQQYYIQSDLKIQFNAEKQIFDNTIQQMKQKINELESNLEYTKKENLKLQQLSIERTKEIEQWKKKLQENNLQKEIQTLRLQLEDNKQQLYNFQEENLTLIQEKNHLQTQLNSTSESLQNKVQELMKSTELISYLKGQMGNNASKLHNFQNLSEGLKKQQDSLEGEILLKCEIIENVKGKYNELMVKVDKLEEENNRLQQQLEDQFEELITREKELELVKLKSNVSPTSTALLSQKVQQNYSSKKPSNWKTYQYQNFSTQS